MVEAMFERTPEYVRQFQKFFDILFAIMSLNLILILQKNFAFSQHKNEDHCKIQQFHYHVIAAFDQLPQSFKGYFF